jgi:cellulose synthase/poly-beta-1,6-N-acetylglucosamine synthase-like glycosyltransferase
VNDRRHFWPLEALCIGPYYINTSWYYCQLLCLCLAAVPHLTYIGYMQLKTQNKSNPPYSLQLKRRPERRWVAWLLYPYVIIGLSYMAWRTTVINWYVWYGPVVYLAEAYSMLSTVLFAAIAQRIYDPVYQPTKLQKTVDIIIATYSEGLDVLEPVVLGATKVRGHRNILVLDDGNRPEVAQMAESYGAQWIPRTTNEHAKAGNLNNGLAHSDAEFLLELDADHVPLPWFIERTLGYFDDPDLAFVQSPQTFYNRETFLFRHHRTKPTYWFEQRMFYETIQPAKNRWNAAFFVGTSAMLRRSAIDSIGGFATGTATEDIHTAARLHAGGWKSLFVPEVLAYGLEAESYSEFYKQRRRWAAGSLGLLFRSSDSPLWATGYTLGQRLNYAYSTMAHLQGAQKLFLFALPIICLFTLQAPITGAPGLYAAAFWVYLATSLVITHVYARGTYHALHTEAYNMANLPAHVGGLKGIFKVQKKFAVSSKSKVKREPSWSGRLVWGMGLVAVLAIARASWLISSGNHSGIVLISLAFTVVNLICIASFLQHLRRYESQAVLDTPTDAPAFYDHIHALHTSLEGQAAQPDTTLEPVTAQE